MLFVVLMGPPGAGKGTQAKLLQEALGIPQVATGDLFRHNLSHDTELGRLAKTYMDAGELVPDEVTVAMVRERLAEEDCSAGAILDGFPRTVSQAQALDALLQELGSEITVVPAIHVDEDVLVARLLKRAEIEGRLDDNEETIRVRMRVYRQQTEPLLAYYREKGLLETINGKQGIEAVQRELLEVVRRAAAASEQKLLSGGGSSATGES